MHEEHDGGCEQQQDACGAEEVQDKAHARRLPAKGREDEKDEEHVEDHEEQQEEEPEKRVGNVSIARLHHIGMEVGTDLLRRECLAEFLEERHVDHRALRGVAARLEWKGRGVRIGVTR